MTRVAILLFLAALVTAGCSRKDDDRKDADRGVRKTCAAVKAATRGIYRIEGTVAGDAAKRPTFVSLDVAGMTAKDLKAKLLEMGEPGRAHLWMPGEQSWIVVKHAADEKVSLAKALDALADDDVCTISLPEVFASYVGTLADVLPAFASDLKGEVVPEWFVTKDVQDIPWLDAAGVDADIAKGVRAEIRSMQNVRREVLKGNMAACAAKDKKGEEAACEIWAKAALRNPNDTLLLERIETLERNAKGFLEVGRPLQAMKCFETIILIQPKHASAVHNFGLCLQKLGKRDLADQVLKRAETLRQAAEADAAK